MSARPSDRLLAIWIIALVAMSASFVDAGRLKRANAAASARTAQLVERLQLTDPVLFTEARYTRHPTQADLHSAFQSHPLALEHFPSGTLIRPPRGFRGVDERVD